MSAKTLVGFDTEVGEAIAEILGVKAVFVEGEWDGLLAGLEVGRYDLMINGVEITDERSEKYDFTDAYAYIRTALIVGSVHSFAKGFAVVPLAHRDCHMGGFLGERSHFERRIRMHLHIIIKR